MNPSPSDSQPLNNTSCSSNAAVPAIPVEIANDEEMVAIDAPLQSSLSSSSLISEVISPTRSSSPSSSHLQQNTSSIRSRTESSLVGDIEDSDGFRRTQKRERESESLYHRFRSKTGLFVTDITATEWCEKQMEFTLLPGKPESSESMKAAGRAYHAELEEEESCEKHMEFLPVLRKPKINKAMKAGRDRHAELEEEVVKKVKVRVESEEDIWALKFMNFINGANQLLCVRLTRELPVLGFAEGVWMVGVIDEIRMPSDTNPILVETKTRKRKELPSEPQGRKGRLQLMCYKYLWDNLVTDNFSSKQFFDFFSLNPHNILSEEIRENTASDGFPSKTLDELVSYFRDTCCKLLPAHDELLLRYEFQEDNSLLDEDKFAYDSDRLKSQLQHCLEFWLGEREANYTPKEERWKCRCCNFRSGCQGYRARF